MTALNSVVSLYRACGGDLSSLSNGDLRKIKQLLPAALAEAEIASRQGSREALKALVDATGHAATVSYEVVVGVIGAVVPFPFNVILVGGAVFSGAYKLFDGRRKFARLIRALRGGRVRLALVRLLRRIAEEVEREIIARIHRLEWP